MLLSDLISQLAADLAEHGDIEVCLYDRETTEIDFVTRTGILAIDGTDELVFTFVADEETEDDPDGGEPLLEDTQDYASNVVPLKRVA